MGPQSEPQIFRECALTAEACGFARVAEPEIRGGRSVLLEKSG